jgi:hypothetical protein
MAVHHLSEGFHRPPCRPIRRRLGHRLDQQQHVVVVIDTRPPRTFLVTQTDHTELAVAASPHRDLVVVHVDDLTDVPVGAALGGEQHDPGPLGEACLDRSSPAPRLQHRSITRSQIQRR